MNIRRVLGAGIVASIVMGMVEMIYEAVGGAGFWSPVVFIAATVLRSLQSVPIPVLFMAMAVIFGLMGHMMNSMIFGLTSRRSSRASRYPADRSSASGSSMRWPSSSSCGSSSSLRLIPSC